MVILNGVGVSHTFLILPAPQLVIRFNLKFYFFFQILSDIELLVRDLSEELVSDLSVRDELEYEKERKKGCRYGERVFGVNCQFKFK